MEINYLKLALALVTLCLSLELSAQNLTKDNQWLILDSKGKNGIDPSSNQNAYGLTTTFNSAFLIDGVAYPRPGFYDSDLDIQRNFYNRFLAIYTNGEYALVNFPNNSIAPDPDYGNSFNLTPAGEVLHLYLSNIYEEDDPPERVVVGGSDSSLPNRGLGNSTSIPLRINHNPADGDDITMIIGDLPPESNCTLNYSIDGISGTNAYNDFRLEPSGFVLGKNAFGGASAAYFNRQFDTNRELLLDVGNYNSFLNFRVDCEDPVYVGKKFNLTLSCSSGDYSLGRNDDGSYLISSGPKDPNYVELQCVWEEEKKCKWLPFIKKKKKYARYKIYCYNESESGVVDNLKYTFTLPSFAKYQEIQLKPDAVYGVNRSVCDACLDNTSRNVVYDFSEGLDVYPRGNDPERHFGTITFCVEVDNSTDLHTADFRLTDPLSHFDEFQYPIYNFIDVERECEFTRKRNPENSGKDVKGYWTCRRELKECPCALPGVVGPVERKEAVERKALPRQP